MEEALLALLQSARVPLLVQLFALVSAFGNAAFIWFVLALIMVFLPERRRAGMVTIIALVITLIVGNILCGIIGRTRPCIELAAITSVVGVSQAGASFPDLHTATSFAAAIVFFLLSGRRSGVAAFVLAALMAFAQMYLGVAYPTDVLAGIVLGLVIGVLVSYFYNQYFGDFLMGKIGIKKTGKRKSVNIGKHSRF